MVIGTILSLVVGAAGVVLAIYFGRENRRLQQRLTRFTWADIEAGCKYLASRIEPEYSPDLILCSSPGSVGIVANLYLSYVNRYIPLYLGVSKKVDAVFASSPLFTDRYETNRWETFLPADLHGTDARKVLILEDVVISGETLREMVTHLLDQGFDKSQIKTAALFCTDLAADQGHTPDYYWTRIQDTHFELPWGRSVGKGF